MARIVAVMAVAAALAAMPAAAPAAPRGGGQAPAQQQAPPVEQQPLLQDVPQQAPAPQPTQTPVTEANSGSLSAGELLLIALGIVALIGGIWFVISRDARRATAGRVRTADAELGAGRGGSATRAARRSRRLSAEERRRRRRGRAR